MPYNSIFETHVQGLIVHKQIVIFCSLWMVMNFFSIKELQNNPGLVSAHPMCGILTKITGRPLGPMLLNPLAPRSILDMEFVFY